MTTLAKWLLVGRFTEGQHPLWSSFVWRNELFDVFYEELGVPWFGGPFLGTPIFNAWARTLGVKIGKGVWLESHWLPETDLVRLEDGATVNRGCVLQTHLFHDRLMRIERRPSRSRRDARPAELRAARARRSARGPGSARARW